MDKDAKFESKDVNNSKAHNERSIACMVDVVVIVVIELKAWLRSRGIDEEDAGTAAATLFTNGFKKPSTLLGINSDYLLRVGLDVPLAMELSNKLQQPQQQQQQQIPAETLLLLKQWLMTIWRRKTPLFSNQFRKNRPPRSTGID